MMVKKWFLAITMVSLLSASLSAANILWDAGGGADDWWGTAANWAGDVLPGTADVAQVNRNDGKGPTIKTGDAFSVTQLVVGLNSGGTNSKLDMTGGDFDPRSQWFDARSNYVNPRGSTQGHIYDDGWYG